MTTLLLVWVFILAAEKNLKCEHKAVNVAVTVDIQ